MLRCCSTTAFSHGVTGRTTLARLLHVRGQKLRVQRFRGAVIRREFGLHEAPLVARDPCGLGREPWVSGDPVHIKAGLSKETRVRRKMRMGDT